MGSGKGQTKRINIINSYKKLEGINKNVGAKITASSVLWNKYLLDNHGMYSNTTFSKYYLGKQVKTEEASNDEINYIFIELMNDMLDANAIYKPMSGHYELLSKIEKIRLANLIKKSSIKIENNVIAHQKFITNPSQVKCTKYSLLDNNKNELASHLEPARRSLLISGKIYKQYDNSFKTLTPADVIYYLLDQKKENYTT